MRAVTLVAFAAAWIVAAVLLYHTSVPPLHLSGLDEHRYFTAHELQRAHTYATGERVIWLLRLNYVRLRRQHMSPAAAASSELLRQHEEALGQLSPSLATALERTQARAPRPLPPLPPLG